MLNLTVQIKHLPAEGELNVVESRGSFKSKALNEHSGSHSREENSPHPVLKWAF